MNPYEILRIGPEAGADQLRRAWRRRALETHPDHGGDDASFHLVHQAFLRLSGARAGGNAPVVVRRMNAAALALRWCRRRRDRTIRPRVV